MLILDGTHLSVADLARVAREGTHVAISDAARSRIQQSRDIVDRTFDSKKSVYGLNTGVGVLKRANLDGDVAAFNRRLLEFHQLAQGPCYDDDVVRAATCRLINQYASGVSGVRPDLVDHLVDTLNSGREVAVHSDGNLLLSNADFALGLVGDFPLSHGEGLSLLGHTMLTDAQAALLLHDLDLLVETMEVAAALSLEAFQAKLSPLDARIANLKNVRGIHASSAHMRAVLAGSELFREGRPRNLQDPVSFRSSNYLLGALRDCLDYARGVVAAQLNSSAGNPVVDVESAEILHAPNWEVQNLSSALDFVKIALVPPLFAAHERVMKLLDRFWSGLPTGLVGSTEQAESGLAMFQVLVCTYAAKLKLAATPTSFDLTTTSQAEGIEDRETGGVLTVATAGQMLALARKIIAIELIVAAQAVELRGESRGMPRLDAVMAEVRRHIPFVRIGDLLPRDHSGLIEAMGSGRLAHDAVSA
jgi:histidine ammonia-lyase